jgi:hypothetical protein
MLTPIVNYRRPHVSQGIPIGYYYATGQPLSVRPAKPMDAPLEKLGCTDPKANNYDSKATKDDGSCTYEKSTGSTPTSSPTALPISGCTDPSATNYMPGASKDDGSCQYAPIKTVRGCTDPKATNYNSSANSDDGSCKYSTITQQPTEPLTILGCTDPRATNYDSKATKNDGSCKYPDTVIQIDSNGTLTTIKDGEVTSAVTTGGGGGYGGGGYGGGIPSEEEVGVAPSKPKNKLVGLILLAGLAYVGFKIIK